MTQPPSHPPSAGPSGPSVGDSSQDSSQDSVRGSETPRGGRVTIVGRPNVGKSTLLNSLLGQKLAITTSRPGTTRANVLGVYSSADPPTQIAFLDTPGMARPKTALHRLLGELARGGLSGVDAVVLMTDRAGKDGGVFEPDRAVLDTIRETGAPIVLVVNKADRFKPRDKMLPLLAQWQEAHDFAAIVPTVATTGKNVDALVRELREIMPEGFLYEPDYLTDRPERFFAAELVREAVMRHTREEVPYGAAVLVEEWDDEPNITRIHAVLVVEKPSHKKIVIGAGGSMLKTIGTEARLQIEELLQRKAYLKLWVKVVPGWTDSPGRVREMTGATEG